jgi:catechol 2,3-dioxygenase-like lactoylglutathione lyase family enzyme
LGRGPLIGAVFGITGKGLIMFSHVTIGTNNLSLARKFYDPVLQVLGHLCFSEGNNHRAYGKKDGEQIWIIAPFDGEKATAGNGTHIAFIASDRESVNNFHRKALAFGGIDEGQPGLRKHYHPAYYGAYIRDLDGNKLQAVCHKKF